jgi:hypothetical protein
MGLILNSDTFLQNGYMGESDTFIETGFDLTFGYISSTLG